MRFRNRLALEITVVLVVKVLLLAGIWYAVVRPNRVEPDPQTVGSHLLGGAAHLNKQTQEDSNG